MTRLEHQIENCLFDLKRYKSYEEIRANLERDYQLGNNEITPDQCWEICQYVWYSFIPYLKSIMTQEELKAWEEWEYD